MAIDAIAMRLMALDAFRGLDPVLVETIAREADRIIYRDGQTLAEAGQPGDGAVVIVAGAARLLADPTSGIPESLIEAGAMIGELAMLSERNFSVSVVADGDVRAVKITRETLHRLMMQSPALAGHFEARLVARLSRLALELRLIDERLAAASAMPERATA